MIFPSLSACVCVRRRRRPRSWSSTTAKHRSGWSFWRRKPNRERTSRRRTSRRTRSHTNTYSRINDVCLDCVMCTYEQCACAVQDCEEGAVKELLLKGENLQKRVPDQDKREQLRLKHNQLNSKYNAVKVTSDCETPDIDRKSESLSRNTRSSSSAAHRSTL